jgi:predicted nucleic acid-binding protein
MEKIEPAPATLVVCDAGPVIHLDELGCIDLMEDFAEVLIPEAVWQEVRRHRPAITENLIRRLRRINPTAPPPPQLTVMAQVLSLHLGEWEALRLAWERRPCLFLTDDTAARLAAGNLGLSPHGTIGILVRAIRRNLRSKEDILGVLHSLTTKSTLHVKRSLLDSVIREVEQHA